MFLKIIQIILNFTFEKSSDNWYRKYSDIPLQIHFYEGKKKFLIIKKTQNPNYFA